MAAPNPLPPPAAPFETRHLLARSVSLWLRHGRECWLVPLFMVLPCLVAERLLDLVGTLPSGAAEPWAATVAVTLFVPTLTALQAFVSAAALHWARGRPAPATAPLLASVLRRLPALLFATVASGVLVLAGTFLFVIPGLVALALTWLAVPILLAEPELSGLDALRRSLDLARESWGRILPVALLIPACGLLMDYSLRAGAENPLTDRALLELLAEIGAVGVLTLQAVAQSVAYALVVDAGG